MSNVGLSSIYFVSNEIIGLARDGASFRVGLAGVTRIIVVLEQGQMSLVPWFEIWGEGGLIARTDACGWTVHYQQEQK